MKNRHERQQNAARGFCLLLTGMLALVATAATNVGELEVGWYTVDGGGGTSAGALSPIEVSGTIGQPDAGTSSSGPITLVGGYWAITGVVFCPADLDASGGVEIVDLLALLGSWGDCPGCPADLNGDDVVDIVDLLNLLSKWGPCR
ncbi:MAG: hypothetical protein ACYTGG_07945, partial [Planctomycetota bacterium]